MSAILVRIDGERRSLIKDDSHRKWCACIRAFRFRIHYFGMPTQQQIDAMIAANPIMCEVITYVLNSNQRTDRAVIGQSSSQNPNEE